MGKINIIKARHIEFLLDEKNKNGFVEDYYFMSDKIYNWKICAEFKNVKIGDIVKVDVTKRNKGIREIKIVPVVVVDVVIDFETSKYKIKKMLGFMNKEKSIAQNLADKCNLSEKSIDSLIKKNGLEKVEKSIDMMLAVEKPKAPLKFLKFILEKIE